MKKIKTLLLLSSAIFVLALAAVGDKSVQAAGLSKDEAFKAIVKIKTFTLNEDSELVYFSSGSGAIIDQRGIVLTNHHVVTVDEPFDGSEREASFAVCLTTEMESAPDCSYTARLIASDKGLDVALLQIDNISGYGSLSSFPFLGLNVGDTSAVNDELVALGYPEIGGETITVTTGVVSGKDNKYGKNWIKTDAAISYGSSGGAAVDSNGGIIGITSSAHSDTLGSLGYIISAGSLNAWVDSNLNRAARNSSLTARTAEVEKKIMDLEAGNVFTNKTPSFKVNKPDGWTFTFGDETDLMIDNESDDEGGSVLISFSKLPYAAGIDAVDGLLRQELSSMLSMVSIVKNEDAVVGGRSAKKILISAAGEQMNMYYVPAGNFLIKIIYNYGSNDKDLAAIDGIISSLSFPSANQAAEITSFSYTNPKFSWSVGGGWVMLPKNLKEHPLTMANKTDKLAFMDIEIQKTDENNKNSSNDEYLASLEQEVKDANIAASMINAKILVRQKNAHYRLSASLPDVIMIEGAHQSVSEQETFSLNRAYYIKTGDRYLIISLKYLKDDEARFNSLVSEFNSLLGSLAVGSVQAVIANPQSKAANKDIKNVSLYNKLKGKIIIRVEENGEAYYVHPSDKKVYYLGRPEDAFAVMRERGVGITNANLKKIPIGLSSMAGPDTDRDGLSDAFEDAAGTDKNKADSDGDGYNDKVELSGGYNPNGSGKMSIDNGFAAQGKGKIFLQVEGKGEAWYVSADGKRYFLGRPADAFAVMRNLGLGISNNDFGKL